MKNLHIAIALAIASSAATAGVVDMKFTGTGSGSLVQLHINGGTQDLFAGEINHEITGAVGAESYLNGAHKTFCPDISEVVTSEFEQYIVTEIEDVPLTDGGAAPMGIMKANAIRALFGQTIGTLEAGNLANSYAAAFQIVIWEIVSDFDGTAASIDATAGSIAFTNQDGTPLDAGIISAIDGLKIQMLNAINGGQTDFADVIGLANAGYQDQLVVVPAPGAIALMTIGGLVATRRRRS